MTTAEILNAAAELIEDSNTDDVAIYSATSAISEVAPNEIAALDAIGAFSRFLRTDGIGSERAIGTTRPAIVAALRQAAQEAS